MRARVRMHLRRPKPPELRAQRAGPRLRHRPLQTAEPLRRDVERAVEFARQVLKGDEPDQLDDRIVVEVTLQARHRSVIDAAIGIRHCLGVIECRLFAPRKQIRLAPSIERLNLRLTHTALDQRGRVDVDAEGAMVGTRARCVAALTLASTTPFTCNNDCSITFAQAPQCMPDNCNAVSAERRPSRPVCQGVERATINGTFGISRFANGAADRVFSGAELDTVMQ